MSYNLSGVQTLSQGMHSSRHTNFTQGIWGPGGGKREARSYERDRTQSATSTTAAAAAAATAQDSDEVMC